MTFLEWCPQCPAQPLQTCPPSRHFYLIFLIMKHTNTKITLTFIIPFSASVISGMGGVVMCAGSLRLCLLAVVVAHLASLLISLSTHWSFPPPTPKLTLSWPWICCFILLVTTRSYQRIDQEKADCGHCSISLLKPLSENVLSLLAVVKLLCHCSVSLSLVVIYETFLSDLLWSYWAESTMKFGCISVTVPETGRI